MSKQTTIHRQTFRMCEHCWDNKEEYDPNSSATRCSACRFLVTESVLNPSTNFYITFGVTVTESPYKVLTINLNIFWLFSNTKRNGQSLNLFETFARKRRFNIKEGQSPSILLRVVESKWKIIFSFDFLFIKVLATSHSCSKAWSCLCFATVLYLEIF